MSFSACASLASRPLELEKTPQPVVVSARDVGKCYRLYSRPADRLKQALFRRRVYYREHWSLRNVSFEIARGEKVGIIGRNGAGKSTLLKILAGILAPTEGEIRRSGKVFPLLELGIGFDPEFTGRENVYTSAAIFGMSRAATDARIEEIVAFADIGEYLDQPVKTYSSGMFARLAMALALHLDAELLLIDEILSVGDIFFQTKCFRRLESRLAQGATVLLCSHDLGAVRRYCSRVLYFADGALMADGPPDQVLGLYLRNHETNQDAGRDKTRRLGRSPSVPKPLARVAGAAPQPTVYERPSEDYPLRQPPEWQPDDDFRSVIRSVRGIVALPNGNLLVAELFSHGLFEVARTGRVVRRWTQKGFGDDELYDPVGLEPLPDGGIAAADYTTGRIAAVYADGAVRRLFAGANVGSQPYLVRLAPDGKAWVFSRLAALQVFAGQADTRGNVVLPERDWYPTDVVFRDGEALVADFRNHEILVFDAQTTRWKRTISLKFLAEARAPHGLAIHGDALVATCHDSNTLLVLPGMGRDPSRAVCLDLAGWAVEHPCYLLVETGRAYLGFSTLGAMTAFDLSGWEKEVKVQNAKCIMQND